MSSVQEVIRSAFSRSKFCKTMYDKLVKERGPSQDLYLVYSSYLAEGGRLRESLDILYYAIKNFANHLTVEKIIPVVSKIVDNLRQETKENSNLGASRDPFSCPSCCGVLFEPLTIPCGHTYCKRCLLKDMKLCLVCQTKVPNLDDNSCDVRSNVLISSLVDKWWGKQVHGVMLRTRANKYFKERQLTKALELYTEAVEYAPNDHLLLSNRSHTFHALGMAEEALRDANEAVLRRPEWAKGHFRQATALLSLGREEDALVAMLVCAAIENSRDLESVLGEIARMLLLIMGRYSRRPPSEISLKHFIPFVLPEEEESRYSKEDSDQGKSNAEGKLSSLRKRRLSESTISGYNFIVEGVPVVTKILKKFTDEVEQIRNNTTAYVRSVDPVSVYKSDFECSLCYHYLWEPVTTPCGHTFCRTCLDRCLDHAIHCPLCKTSLREYLAENRSSITEFVEAAMRTQIPNEYKERGLQHDLEMSEFAEAGKDLQHEIPIFVATLAIPSVACPLHVFEPRYRLMIRRVMEAGTREFGMCMPSESEENGYCSYGTMLEVREVKPINDGRRIVNAVGSRRFKCISKGVKDGYNTATVEYLKDDHVTESSLEELQQLHNSVYQKSRDWFNSIEGQTQRRILSHYGPMPPVENEYWNVSDGPVWIWWLIAILPLEPCIQMRIIRECSLQVRLNLVSQILRWVVMHQSRPE